MDAWVALIELVVMLVLTTGLSDWQAARESDKAKKRLRFRRVTLF